MTYAVLSCVNVYDTGCTVAGFLEGYLTAQRIYDHHVNMEAFFGIETSGPSDWLLAQDAWAQEQAATNTTPFWATLSLILQQHEGLMDGYNLAASRSGDSGANTPPLPQLDRIDFLKLSAVGAVLDHGNCEQCSMQLGITDACRNGLLILYACRRSRGPGPSTGAEEASSVGNAESDRVGGHVGICRSLQRSSQSHWEL